MESDDNRGGEGLGSGYIDWRNSFDDISRDAKPAEPEPELRLVGKIAAGTLASVVSLTGLVTSAAVGGCSLFLVSNMGPANRQVYASPGEITETLCIGAVAGAVEYGYGIYRMMRG